MEGYINIFLRSVIAFAGLLLLTHLMGRKQLSQINFFDYIVGITVGSITASIVVDRSINVISNILLASFYQISMHFMKLCWLK